MRRFQTRNNYCTYPMPEERIDGGEVMVCEKCGASVAAPLYPFHDGTGGKNQDITEQNGLCIRD